MPKLSGIENLREIRKIDGEVPIIIITGYGTQKDKKGALHYGVTDFISNPFNTSKIISVIICDQWNTWGANLVKRAGFKRETREMAKSAHDSIR